VIPYTNGRIMDPSDGGGGGDPSVTPPIGPYVYMTCSLVQRVITLHNCKPSAYNSLGF
jgi:hypothetical protein